MRVSLEGPEGGKSKTFDRKSVKEAKFHKMFHFE